MARRRRQQSQQPGLSRRERLAVGTFFAVIALAGLALVLVAAGYRWRLAQRADRVRAEGRQVSATVTDVYQRHSRDIHPNYLELSYRVGGRDQHARVACGRSAGCTEVPGSILDVWVDPARPGDIVTAGGHATGSASFLAGTWGLVLGGTIACLVGGVGVAAMRAPAAPPRPRRRRRRPAGGARPRRRRAAGR